MAFTNKQIHLIAEFLWTDVFNDREEDIESLFAINFTKANIKTVTPVTLKNYWEVISPEAEEGDEDETTTSETEERDTYNHNRGWISWIGSQLAAAIQSLPNPNADSIFLAEFNPNYNVFFALLRIHDLVFPGFIGLRITSEKDGSIKITRESLYNNETVSEVILPSRKNVQYSHSLEGSETSYFIPHRMIKASPKRLSEEGEERAYLKKRLEEDAEEFEEEYHEEEEFEGSDNEKDDGIVDELAVELDLFTLSKNRGKENHKKLKQDKAKNHDKHHHSHYQGRHHSTYGKAITPLLRHHQSQSHSHNKAKSPTQSHESESNIKCDARRKTPHR